MFAFTSCSDKKTEANKKEETTQVENVKIIAPTEEPAMSQDSVMNKLDATSGFELSEKLLREFRETKFPAKIN